MLNFKDFNPIALPSNLMLLTELYQALLQRHKLHFFIYPTSSFILISYNPLCRSVAMCRVLPFLVLFLAKPYIYLIKKESLLLKSAAVYWHSFIKLFKTLTIASFGSCKITQFVGFRFRQRWYRKGQVLRLRAGYNKKVWVKCPWDFVSFIKKHNPKKRTHSFFSFDKRWLKKVVSFMHLARPSTLYKGRGINLKEQPLELRDGKKTLW